MRVLGTLTNRKKRADLAVQKQKSNPVLMRILAALAVGKRGVAETSVSQNQISQI